MCLFGFCLAVAPQLRFHCMNKIVECPCYLYTAPNATTLHSGFAFQVYTLYMQLNNNSIESNKIVIATCACVGGGGGGIQIMREILFPSYIRSIDQVLKVQIIR